MFQQSLKSLSSLCRADNDLDGVLDSFEFDTVFPKQKYGKSLRALFGNKNILELIDQNYDGLVSRDELLTFVAPRYERAVARYDFAAADNSERDGRLTVDEYKYTNYAMERVLHDASDVHAQTFNVLDTNNDASVDVDEFIDIAGVDRFSRIDRDKDGKVTPKEYLLDEMEHYKHHHEGITEEEITDRVSHVFSDLDRDGDGTLTRSEERGGLPDERDQTHKPSDSHLCTVTSTRSQLYRSIVFTSKHTKLES